MTPVSTIRVETLGPSPGSPAAGRGRYRRGPARLALVLFAAAAALAGGCRRTVVGPDAPGAGKVTKVRGGAAVDPATGVPDAAPASGDGQLVVPQPTRGGGELSGHPDDLAGDDACRVRIDAIREPLIVFVLMNKRMPATLEELKAADPKSPLDLTCPASGKPYVYVPAGLRDATATGKAAGRRLVLYDPTPAHRDPRNPDKGLHRRGIVMNDPAGNKALVVDAVELTEKEFQAYAANPLNPKPAETP